MEAHRLSRSKQPSNANGDRSCSPLSLKTLFLMCLGVCISLAVGLTIMFPDYIGSSYVTQSTRRGKKVNLVRTKQSTKGKVVNGTTGNVTSYDYGNMKVINAFTERLSYPWKRNITKLEHIRKEIQDFVKLKNNYILTKTNVHVGQKLPYSASPSRTFTLSKKVFNILGKVSPIGDKHYNTCTIVGNGGIILGSGCGHDIDSTEYVFRCNVSPLKAYSTDTGSKSNLVTVNKSLLSYSP
ncbi:alpha-N-acetylneuraminate alpha-2,8-sialyltransferase ST8SIA3-like [Saccoglossus kowalevskii]|uniref:Sia-alpha-2,3-Gal-beta-1,4-GlcNAc-R:alpha 2,8-sialyltransferase-like n=1 Tax=Saccoglossus kowalevskii TaxID=10224 RepID=A0ABM0MZ73_SACKO|nr:PREDICTED: sia-alpha-2,3-Gal-beta-1,4-GlcNAc-R:alpha 2,8-sialyltransferase-like [Saccoglossus kowalevskii]